MKKRTISTIAVIALAFGLVQPVTFAQKANGQSGARAVAEQAAQQASKQATGASDLAAQIKNKSENTSRKVRQEVCEQKRIRLQTATQTMYQGAESVKKSLDTMYDRAVAFYNDGQLTVSDFEQRIEKLALTKQLATNQMTALQTRDGSDVDCADAKTASRLEGDRLAGQAVKTQLKQYRTELVDLISSMRSASATEGKDNE